MAKPRTVNQKFNQWRKAPATKVETDDTQEELIYLLKCGQLDALEELLKKYTNLAIPEEIVQKKMRDYLILGEDIQVQKLTTISGYTPKEEIVQESLFLSLRREDLHRYQALRSLYQVSPSLITLEKIKPIYYLRGKVKEYKQLLEGIASSLSSH